MPTYCSCWAEYPNEAHKKASGAWKCKDKYICIRQRQGATWAGRGLKTKCVKKEGLTNEQ